YIPSFQADLSQLHLANRLKSKLNTVSKRSQKSKPVFSRGPSPSGRGRCEAAGEGNRSTLIRPFGPPSPKGGWTRAILWGHLGQPCLRGMCLLKPKIPPIPGSGR